jgi:hypothetical protein
MTLHGLAQLPSSFLFYAMTPERRLTHPAVLAITEHAQKSLFL